MIEWYKHHIHMWHKIEQRRSLGVDEMVEENFNHLSFYKRILWQMLYYMKVH